MKQKKKKKKTKQNKKKRNGNASKNYCNTTYGDLQVRTIAQNCSDYKPSKLIAIQWTFILRRCGGHFELHSFK